MLPEVGACFNDKVRNGDDLAMYLLNDPSPPV
jgi:hypothetical protein